MEGATSVITTCLANVSTVISEGVEIITGNEVGALFIGLGIAGAAVGFVKALMH